MNNLEAVTSLDGRYHNTTQSLSGIFSEYGLMKSRVQVEISWFKFLSAELKLFALDKEQISAINAVLSDFTVEEAQKIKDIEKTTNHDVKAVEYYLKEQFEGIGLNDVKEWLHFSCTSADINNTSYALMVKEGREVLNGQLNELLVIIDDLAKRHKSTSMMSRTHGQPATPTTVGKEFANFGWRLKKELQSLNNINIEAKFNGATGNFNAHFHSFPKIDWMKSSEKFIESELGLSPILLSTQINPNNYLSEILHSLIRLSSIFIDLNRDVWGYISLGYFKQKVKEGEVGSSTMPHKVNPIDFENSEGNLGVAISLMEHLSTKLLNSRFQRDLTDSTVMRNLGAVFGYILLGFNSAKKGLNKIDINIEAIDKDLEQNWELLAEPIQTIMRVYGEDNPYEKLKSLTRGQKIGQKELEHFIENLSNVPSDVKEEMKKLTPHNYVGMAEQLVDRYLNNH